MTRTLPLLAVVCAAPFALAAGPAGPGPFARHDPIVEPLLARMTLEEKVGQMTQGELGSLGDLEDVKELALGSVLSGGDSDPKAGNSVAAWADTYDACQRRALATRLGIPLLYGVDAVHGHNNVAGSVVFPHNIGLGCAGDEELVEEVSRLTALDVRATGIQWAFAPCVTVPQDDRWGRTYEGFGEDPALVSRLGAAAVRGLQGESLADPLRVLGCAKHFVADGGTVPATRQSHHGALDAGVRDRLDQGDARISEATLRETHLPPYFDAIAAGVGSIMPSYSSWNGVKCTGHRYLLTDVLKEELGFEGFLISDYAAIDQVDPDYKTAIAKSVNAGIDMAMVPYRHREFHTLLVELVREGKVPASRIDDAVRRILRVKAAMGMLDPSRSQLTDRGLAAGFSGPEHLAVARRAAAQSVVVLKNEAEALPLRRGGRIVVAGAAADDLGRQCGGWTISWQGKAGAAGVQGTTLLAALRSVAGPGGTIDYTPDGAGVTGADVAVVVVGEAPYAEGLGDDFDLELPADDRAVVDRVAASGAPMVLVVLSGRPLAISAEIGAADAVVAAWLPGSAGEGVADVLFGDRPAEGRLSFAWPRSADQHPLGAKSPEAMYPVGWGLTPRGLGVGD